MTDHIASSPRPRVLLYGDVSLNVVDGSSVWLISMAEALVKAGAQVDLLSKARIERDHLVSALRGLSHLTIIDPRRRREDSYSQADAAAVMCELDEKHDYAGVFLRGLDISRAMADQERFRGRLWAYLTDYPQNIAEMTPSIRRRLECIATQAKRMFAQTEDSRSYLEFHVPEFAGKTLLLPPMLPAAPKPAVGADAPRSAVTDDVLKLIYVGKFAKNWHTMEMCRLPQELAERGIRAELTMIGDKIHREPRRPQWRDEMKKALEETPGVTWVGGMPRAEAMAAMRGHHVGLGWRSSSLDTSHELSTKLLEYIDAGLLPAVNDNGRHRELLGRDYPLLVGGDLDSLVDALAAQWESRGSWSAQHERLQQLGSDHSIDAAAKRLAVSVVDRLPAAQTDAGPVNVVVAGHDFKFCGELFDMLDEDSRANVIVDDWRGLRDHSLSQTQAAAAAAEIVVCEWAGGNALWYSRNKRPSQRLIVRLHAFELRTQWINSIEWSNVDKVVCVSRYYAGKVVDQLGIPADKVSVIPNTVEVLDLRRRKLPGSEWHVGMVGMVPLLKRPDRAVAVLRELRRLDPRYVLHLKGRLPNEYPWVWKDPVYRTYFRELMDDIMMSEDIAGSVVLDYFGPDIANWYRRIGWCLAPSAEESFHLAPLEAMASGALPVLWQRPGAAEIFGDHWMHQDDAAAIAEHIHSVNSAPERRQMLVKRASEDAEKYDVSRVKRRWHEALWQR